jgi:cytidylate kinase
MRFVVAIDGPAAAGKGTIAKTVSDRFGFAYLDTGLLYRAVGAKTLLGEEPVTAAEHLDPEALNDSNLRSAEVARAASRVASIHEVRAILFDFQRRFAQRAGGSVLDGRDIGTTICPDADLKLFITAAPEIRAKRRLEELRENGVTINYETVLADLKARDARDMSRQDAPLIAAQDAEVIDTSDLTITKSTERAVTLIEAALNLIDQ